MLVTCALVVPGLRWGLPSATRNRLTLGKDRNAWRAPELAADEREDPWSVYPNYLQGGSERTGRRPRSAFNPVRSYHPDEYAILKSLSGMRPSQLKFFHGFFGWPAFHFYVVGGALKVSSWFDAVKLIPKIDFYFRNPEEMARLYLVGRVVTLICALGCILVTWRVARRLFGRAGGVAAAVLLAVTPLFVINAHYLTADVPMLFWVSLTLLAATHVLAGGGRRWYILSGVFLGLAAGTRYQGALAAFLILVAHLMRENKNEETEQNKLPWRQRAACQLSARDLWIAAGVSIFVFLAVNPYMLIKPIQFYNEFIGELRGSRNPIPFAASLGLFVQCGLGLFLAIGMVGALWLGLVRRQRNVLFLLLGLGIPAILLLMGRPVMVRYLMPVLLLPVLLVAFGFATLLRRGCEIGKVRTRAAPVVLLLILVVATALQSRSFSALFRYPRTDTRTLAGKWIDDNIPDGSTVGVISVPWQFELPPLNEKRLKLVIVAQDPEALDRAAPEYFVTSDLQFPPVAVRGPLTEKEEEFRRNVFEGQGKYRILKRVEAWPYGHQPILKHGPHDMRYVNPAIVVSQRRIGSRRSVSVKAQVWSVKSTAFH